MALKMKRPETLLKALFTSLLNLSKIHHLQGTLLCDRIEMKIDFIRIETGAYLIKKCLENMIKFIQTKLNSLEVNWKLERTYHF